MYGKLFVHPPASKKNKAIKYMWLFFDNLSREHCIFFLILSIFAFAAFVVLLGMALFAKNKLLYVGMSLSPLIVYYIYLLFYSMCVNSLK
jgi:hypothetical protein